MKIEEVFEKVFKPQFIKLKIGEVVKINVPKEIVDEDENNIYRVESIYLLLCDGGYIDKIIDIKIRNISENCTYDDLFKN